MTLNEDVKLNKAEKAWKPSSKRASEEEDPENIKTQVRAAVGRQSEGLGEGCPALADCAALAGTAPPCPQHPQQADAPDVPATDEAGDGVVH